MKTDDEIINSVIAGGLIGAALAALVSKHKSDTFVGAIAGAVILASVKASERAKAAKVSILVEEPDGLYKVDPDGTKTFVKHLPKNTKAIPETFIIG